MQSLVFTWFRKQGEWINDNIPERPGNPQLAESGQLTLAQLSKIKRLVKYTLTQAGIGHHGQPYC